LSSSDPVYSVLVTTDPEARVVIFDGYDCVVQRGVGTTNWNLTPGLYTIRAELAGQLVQTRISVPGPTAISLTPQIYSPAPIDGAATTHEYYHDPAEEWSNKRTLTRAELGEGGWLFIFVRLSSKTAARKGDIAQGLSVHDATGNLILDLADKGLTKSDEESGWVLISTPISPGFYRLRHEGEQTREMPLYVYATFSTQVFITYFHRPRLEQMRVFLRMQGLPFEANDLEARAVELALLGLQNGIRAMSHLLPHSDQRDLLQGKFRNPMLGLIGAHWLLEDPSAEYMYVNLVLTNLRALLGPVPDVVALEVAAAKRFKMSYLPPGPILTPPLIRRGVEILVRESPEVILEGDFFESILADAYLDSPWTSWRLPKATSFQSAQFMPESTSAESRPLDWMESAVLIAGLRGEFDEQRIEPIAKQFVVTPAVVRNANKRLLQKLEGKKVAVRFNSDHLAEGQDAAAEVQIDNWAVRGAAVYNQPLPATGFPFGVATVLAKRDVTLHGPSGDVTFRTSLHETQIACGSWDRLLRELDTQFVMLRSALPKPEPNASTWVALSTEYHRETPRGAIALSPTGPSSKPAATKYTLITEGVAWRGLLDSLQAALSEFGLPAQLAGESKNHHQTVLVANVEGSFQFKFDTETRLRLLRGPDENQGQWISADVLQGLPASGTLTASGAFQISLAREPHDLLRFSIHRAARSANAPVYLAKFRVASSGWLSWLGQAAREIEGSSESIGMALDEMAQAITFMVKERAYYHSAQHGSHPEESWYRAEEVETQIAGTSIERVLASAYTSELRSQIERDVSGLPLLELQIRGPQQANLLNQAIQGKFDFRDRTEQVQLSGRLVSVAEKPRQLHAILGPGIPKVIVEDGRRIVAFDPSVQTPASAFGHVDASVAGGSGPAAFSAPSAILTSSFIGATPELLRIGFARLVERWMPEEKRKWQSLALSIGDQAATERWNAIAELKLHWAIDLRKAGRDLEPEPEVVLQVLRRELRLLLPFYYFTEAAAYSNLKTALPLLVYLALPEDVGSAQDLGMNSRVFKNVSDILISLMPALKTAGISTQGEQWSVPYLLETAPASRLQTILAWEKNLGDAIFGNLSLSYLKPSKRAAALDSMATQIVEALSAFPIFINKPRAVNAVRTVIFTTALSLMADSPTNVSAEFSITAIDGSVPLSNAWIASPDSIPLESIIGHGRLSATTESASPMRRQPLAAAAR
jgi:hypothetical protein